MKFYNKNPKYRATWTWISGERIFSNYNKILLQREEGIGRFYGEYPKGFCFECAEDATFVKLQGLLKPAVSGWSGSSSLHDMYGMYPTYIKTIVVSSIKKTWNNKLVKLANRRSN